jgi:hypothetical protein
LCESIRIIRNKGEALLEIKSNVNLEAFRKENLNLIDNASEDTRVVHGKEIENDAFGITLKLQLLDLFRKIQNL